VQRIALVAGTGLDKLPPWKGEARPTHMVHSSPALLFEGSEADELEPRHATGLLPAQHLKSLIEHSREIRRTEPVEPDQLQPASLDLRLGDARVPARRDRCAVENGCVYRPLL
jgi:2'-deoxycytidine 5'-triphosphate deaminase (DCD)